MTLYSVIFYLVAAVIILATGLAITRANPVHAIIYLIISFFGSATLFYLLGAPFLAAMEVIIYAGAIMVLFLFVVLMIRVGRPEERAYIEGRWLPATLLGLIFLAVIVSMAFGDPQNRITLEMAMAMPKEFGRFLFERYWLSVEIVSFLLLIALVAAIQLGRGKGEEGDGGERRVGGSSEE